MNATRHRASSSASISGGPGQGGAVDIATGKLATERIRLPTPSPATPQAIADDVGELLHRIGVASPVGLAIPAVVRGRIVETRVPHRPNLDRHQRGGLSRR